MTQELNLLLAQLTEREQAVSDERRAMHALIDALRKESVARMRDDGITVSAGEDSDDPGSTGVREPRDPGPKARSDQSRYLSLVVRTPIARHPPAGFPLTCR